MDRCGWQNDYFGLTGQFYDPNNPDTSFNCPSYFDSQPYSGYDVLGSTNQSAIEQGQTHRGQISYSSSYLQGPISAPQAPAMLPTAAPRVHINPNYRPKLGLPQEKGDTLSRYVNVHINPHWKGRTDHAPGVSHPKKVDERIEDIPNKKTIFVNPKVLAQIKSVSSAATEETSHLLDLLHFKSENVSTSKLHSPDGVSAKNCNSSEVNAPIVKKTERTDECEPGFYVLSSTKLIRKPNKGSQEKSLNLKQQEYKSQHSRNNLSKPSEISRKAASPMTSSFRMAKQVSSKYKIVRNCVSASSKSIRGAAATPSRRSRRKSINYKQSVPTNSKSLYKFVRKKGDIKSSNDFASSKLAKNIDSSVPSSSLSIKKQKMNSSSYRDERESPIKKVKTRYKLVRVNSYQQNNSVCHSVNKKVKTLQSRYKLVCVNLSKDLPSWKGFLPSSSKYSLINQQCKQSSTCEGRKVSRFRISHASAASKLKVEASRYFMKLRPSCQYSSLSQARVQRSGLYGNISWQKGKLIPSQYLSQKFLLNAAKKRKINEFVAKKTSNRSLLNIGGVLYRSTRTTLTRTQPERSGERIVHIRGRKFILDAKGITLRPESCAESTAHHGSERRKVAALARVDIGGVTFTRRHDNTLVRTNTHHARSLLSFAKMKSIALLTNKHRKNNQPCLIYHRFGRCNGSEKGTCWRVHDPKNIAICRKFLQGTCETEKCLLSHNVGPEKMPTCRYFLEGCCVRDNCPYLHVKLSARAAVCRRFLNGYCADGDTCKKRHVFLCPEFEENGKCSKGKCCPYPHKSRNRDQKPTCSTEKVKVKVVRKCDNIRISAPPTGSEIEKRVRYYESKDENGVTIQENSPSLCPILPEKTSLETSSQVKIQSEVDSDNLEENEDVLQRPKIGILPAYIPLD